MKTVKKTTDEKKVTKRDVVLIHWWDAVSDSGWNNREGLEELLSEEQQQLVWSVGIIVKKDKDFYYLSGDWGMGENPFNRVILIPRGMVKKLTVIKRWRK